MKIEVDNNRQIVLKEVYNSVILESHDKEQFAICMRDTGFEFKYNDIWYEAKEGKVSKIENDESEFIKIKSEKDYPEKGTEVLLFKKSWINQDYNPRGVRIGYLDDVSGWVSAYWCNYHNAYHTRTSNEDNDQFEDFKSINQIPTHWKPLGSSPK